MRQGIVVMGLLAVMVSSSLAAGPMPAVRSAYSTDVLKWRDCLDFVKHGKHAADFTSPCFPGDPAVLTGLTRNDVISLFGGPSDCRQSSEETTEDFGSSKYPKCGTADQWWYSFYTLPEGAVGGGPEIALTFGRDGRVVRTQWVMTQ